ncbi:EamA family transporter [candidate division KSB3 bacterium]|uniref:EamA family transporter n=1 Tax=candidate division KSB3 bacterium TaxID=2044937 RepID=A0A2G6KB54_9BACT|nr:MAG: EamA family transporter [candidate division KSB3 bacterium]
MPFLGEFSALATAALWATSSFLIASVAAKVGSVQANIGRMFVSLVFFLIAIYVFHLPLDLSAKQFTFLVLSALVGIVFGDTFLFKAFQQVGARVSMLIMSIAPAIAAILAYIFLGETLSWFGIFGILITLLGIAIVVLEKKSTGCDRFGRVTTSGLICAFFGALGQGGGVVLVKVAFLDGPINGIVAAGIRIAAALLLFVPLMVPLKQFHNPLPIVRQGKKIILFLVISSFFGTFLGVTLSQLAVAYAKVGIASTLIATSPVLMLPIARIVFKEDLSWKASGGAFLAVGGVAILFLV